MLTSGAAQITFGYELYTAFHGVTGRVLYESRCDSSDRALVLWCALCIECGLQADRQCGYLRCLSEPPLYFSSSLFFFRNRKANAAAASSFRGYKKGGFCFP